MNSSGWAVVIVVLILIVGGAWWYVSQTPAPATNNEATPTATQNETQNTGTETGSNTSGGVTVDGGVTVGVPTSATITYSASGFSPATVTIKKGGTVTWDNQSGGTMWVASAQHPTHTAYDGTARTEHCPDADKSAFDQCAASAGDYSFTFDKVGSWAYHDHINSSRFGRVEVVE
jgi:plastocyanin